MKIAIVYTGLTSYMTDCWRELSRREGVELRVWCEETKAYRFKGDKTKILDGIWCHWDYSENITDIELRQAESEIVAYAPDVIFVCGWSRTLPPYITESKKLSHVPMVLEFDMPWEWTLRKFAARFVLGKRLRRFAAAYVPGKTTARYAKWLGFKSERIYEGRNCIDLERFDAVREEAEKVGGQRNSFLYLGRKAKEKGLEVLEKAYGEYKRLGGSWTLDIPDFVEPLEVPRVMGAHACFILPSKWEPWGVVVLEALAAGMKVIVSDKVGALYDLPVDEVFKSGDWKALAQCMLKVERAGAKTEKVDLSEYGARAWADRVIKICEEVR